VKVSAGRRKNLVLMFSERKFTRPCGDLAFLLLAFRLVVLDPRRLARSEYIYLWMKRASIPISRLSTAVQKSRKGVSVMTRRNQGFVVFSFETAAI
jgi:hypothetical protein